MTKIPHENRDVKGLEYSVEYPKYKVGPLCAVPGCSWLADHAHHIWRRSFLTGNYGWVRLWDGTVVQNLCGLCYKCHSLVTENRALIRWSGHHFLWRDLAKGLDEYLLDPQPKVWGAEPPVVKTVQGIPPEAVHTHDRFGIESCPTCKRRLPKEKTETAKEPAKPREKWTVTVPRDDREKGADVLDTLLDEARKLSPYADANVTKYHVLAWALGMFVLHGENLLSDA